MTSQNNGDDGYTPEELNEELNQPEVREITDPEEPDDTKSEI